MEVTEVDGVAVTVSSNSSFKSCELILDCGLLKMLYKSKVLAESEDPIRNVFSLQCPSELLVFDRLVDPLEVGSRTGYAFAHDKIE